MDIICSAWIALLFIKILEKVVNHYAEGNTDREHQNSCTTILTKSHRSQGTNEADEKD